MIEDREEYNKLSIQMRGQIIDKVIDLESVMETYISSYFCSTDTKMDEFKRLLFWDQQTGLGKKVGLVKYIIEHHHREMLLSWPDIFIDLEDILVYRNKLAHRILDISRKAINKAKKSNAIIVKHLKNAEETEIGMDKIDDLINKINRYTTVFIVSAPPWSHSFPA